MVFFSAFKPHLKFKRIVDTYAMKILDLDILIANNQEQIT